MTEQGTWLLELRALADGTVLASTTLPSTSECPVQVLFSDRSPSPLVTEQAPDKAAVNAFVAPFALAP